MKLSDKGYAALAKQAGGADGSWATNADPVTVAFGGVS